MILCSILHCHCCKFRAHLLIAGSAVYWWCLCVSTVEFGMPSLSLSTNEMGSSLGSKK